MKKLNLFAIFIVVFFIFGFSYPNNEIDSNQKKSILHKNIERDQSPFNLKSIESRILSLNDPSFDKPLTGVVYQISLYSGKKLSLENLSSYKFKLVGNSVLKDALVSPSTYLTLKETSTKGYIYSIQFETNYRDYTQDELKKLINERDFQIIIYINGKKYFIPSTRSINPDV